MMAPPNSVLSWAKSNDIKILTDEQEPRRQYFYVSSQEGATFQVVIEPVLSEMARIDVHLIEGPDYDEAHFILEFPWSRIRHALDLSLMSARFWFEQLSQSKS